MRPVIVPDASVVLKWVLPADSEVGAPEAHRLLADFVAAKVVLLVPGLWYFEVANTLTRLMPNEAAALLAALRALELAEATVTPEWETLAIGLVRQYGVAFYDAAYHALARVCDGTFVTADRKYLDLVGGESNIRDLAGYPWV